MSVSAINPGAVKVYQSLKTQSQPQAAEAAKVKGSNYLRSDQVELSRASLAKAALSSSVPQSPRGAQGAAGAAQSSPAAEVYGRADVQSLLNQWGAAKPGSEYDFNSDGRVDSADLGALLERFGQAKPSENAEAKPYTRADVDRLLDAWNNGDDPERAVNARYDLDGDGRVNSTDLGELLSRLSSA